MFKMILAGALMTLAAAGANAAEVEVKMLNNDVLDAEDLADGIRLVCQSLPASDKLRISYNG